VRKKLTMEKFDYIQKSQKSRNTKASTTSQLKSLKKTIIENLDTNDTPYLTRIRPSYTALLNRYDWDAFVTLEFPGPVGRETAVRMAVGYLNKIRRTYPRMKFAGIIHVVHPEKEKPHLHILLISDHSYPDTLLTVPESELERLWPYQRVSGDRTRGCTFHNSSTVSKKTMTNYVAKGKNMPGVDEWDIYAYRLNLLQKFSRTAS
jgi:hypothetical protein